MNSNRLKAHASGGHRLAESDFAAVDLCACGTLNLHLGALTIRLTRQALASLLWTLDQAADRYDEGAPKPELEVNTMPVRFVRKGQA